MAFRHGKHPALTREEQRARTERLSETTGSHVAAPPSSTASKPPLSRHTSAAHYAHANHAARRKRRIKHVLIALAIVVGVVVVGAAAYVGLINSKLNSDVSPELVGALTGTREPDKPFYMLLLGTDRDEQRADSKDFGSDDSAYRSDSIMLVRVDPPNKKATIVSIHRDTKVDMGDYGTQKINAAYALGGAAYATQVVSKYAGVPISHYVEADMDGMTAIVDQVGGIDIDLPEDVKDPHYTGLDLKAGEQHLDGKTAALLCRARHAYEGDGDGKRASNQRLVIQAVLKKLLGSDPLTMASTVQTMAGYVRTDMSAQYIATLASEFVGMDPSTDLMSAINPTTSSYEDGVWYEITDEDAWKKMMRLVENGEDPSTVTADSDDTDGDSDSGSDSDSGESSSSDSGSSDYESDSDSSSSSSSRSRSGSRSSSGSSSSDDSDYSDSDSD